MGTLPATANPSDAETGPAGTSRGNGKPRSLFDPISAANGAYHFDMVLMNPGGPGGLQAKLFYRSDYLRFNQPLPQTFFLNLFASMRLEVPLNDDTYCTAYLPNGDQVSFIRQPGGEWALTDPTVVVWDFPFQDSQPSQKYVLKFTENHAFLMAPIQQVVYVFELYDPGQWGWARLVKILDRNGNGLAFTYTTPDSGRPSRVEDGLGRSIDFAYAQVGSSTYLSSLTDQGGRQVLFTYEEQAPDNDNAKTLRSVTDPMGDTTTFHYAGRVFLNHLIESVERPMGNTPTTQVYGIHEIYGSEFTRVVSQEDAFGNTSTLTYDAVQDVVNAGRPDGNALEYKHSSSYGFPERITDPEGNTSEFTHTPDQFLTQATDREGGSTNLGYDTGTGLLETVQNARGETITYTYTPTQQTFTVAMKDEQATFTFHDLTRADYPDGTSDTYAYNGLGNLLSHTDAAGRNWTFTYEPHGWPLTRTNPAGGVETFTWNPDGTKASSADTEVGITTFVYDELKRLTQVTHPDGSTSMLAYDADDRVTSLTDENGGVTAFSYGPNGTLTEIRDSLGQTTIFTCDAMDRVSEITDRTGRTVALSYDAMGKVVNVVDAGGIVTTLDRDPMDRIAAVTRSGSTWTSEYDTEGILSARSTPLGHRTTYESDELGYHTAATDALGGRTAITRDAMNRVTGVTDRLDKTLAHTYDASGHLSSASIPGASATFGWNMLDGLEDLTDPNGQVWHFDTSAMGTRTGETDPLGRTTGYTYDTRRRLARIDYPDGSSLQQTVDPVGHITDRLHSDGIDLAYTYDALGRLTSADGFSLALDEEGRVLSTNWSAAEFAAAYDAGGQLATVTYPSPDPGKFDPVTVTYGYDKETGLLESVSDDLTGTSIDFYYDSNLRLIRMERSNNIHRLLTYDDVGRIIRIRDGAFLDLQYTLDAEGQVIACDGTMPLDPADYLEGGGEDLFAYDNASQVSGAGYDYDMRGRMTVSPGNGFTWDGASRLVGAGGTALAYDGMNGILSRNDGKAARAFYRNHAIPGASIIAERDGSAGPFLRYYVWTPGGMLLYSIQVSDDNDLRFYHFDRTGSTLFLTCNCAEVREAYAYTPYGALLAHEGVSDQPFTFCGARGVRSEAAAEGIYQMGLRYYDAMTARFLSPEPLWPRIGDPRDLNPYAYAYANPVNFRDPAGLAPEAGSEVRNPNFNPVGLAFLFYGVEGKEDSYARLDYFFGQLTYKDLGTLNSVVALFEESYDSGLDSTGEYADFIPALRAMARKHRLRMAREMVSGSPAPFNPPTAAPENNASCRTTSPAAADLAAHTGRTETNGKVMGVWISNSVLGMKFIPGGKIRNLVDDFLFGSVELWDPSRGTWSELHTNGDHYREGLGPAEGYAHYEMATPPSGDLLGAPSPPILDTDAFATCP